VRVRVWPTPALQIRDFERFNFRFTPEADIKLILSERTAKYPKRTFTMSALAVHVSYVHESKFSGVNTDGQNK
jgi:hypothetical protein